jgi:FlaA1/EpsC-like NDP-sugar epimerase
MDRLLEGKRVLITGGTGSLGKVLLRRLLSNKHGQPAKLVVLSRDEGKQHDIRVQYQHKRAATDEVIYRNFTERLEFRIGDVRDYHSVAGALRDIDVVFNAAALKQVPTCEYFPYEAVRTNVEGPENIVRAIREQRLPVESVVGVSTDKAVEPVNVMGMTKAIQERIFLRANLDIPGTRFVAVRYGNVLASRGSVIPLFHEQIKNGGPVTITDSRMTRFLLSLEEAVDVIMNALATGKRGETYIPKVPTALMTDVAKALIDGRDIKTIITGIRPGEKLHETLISHEEAIRTVPRGDYYAVAPILPELREDLPGAQYLNREYSSEFDLMTFDQVRELMVKRNLMVGQQDLALDGEFLR